MAAGYVGAVSTTSERTGSADRRGRGVNTASYAARMGIVKSGTRSFTPSWSLEAWGAIGIAATFVAITCWWLTQDRTIPIYDAGDHLGTVFAFHDMIRSGDLLGPFNYESPYPPLGTLVGTVSAFVGGVSVAAPIIGANLVFVALLALGCYQTGRLLFGARAGLLAVAVALGSPLLIAQLHVFMLDAPEAALVAVSIWLLLACEDFGNIRFAALAGLAVGAGLLIKVQFPPFVAGIVLTALVRGGWRNWRGLMTFAIIALVIAAPWYLNHLSQFATFERDAGPHEGVPLGDAPATLSFANLTWYFWNILNSQLLLPLFLLLVGGFIWTATWLSRHRRLLKAPSARREDRDQFGARLEFFAGAVIAWLLITVTPAHDIRYGIPLLPYLAVIATGWIIYLPRIARWAAITLVFLGVSANTLGTSFGVGGTVRLALEHPLPPGEQVADTVTLYSNAGFLVAGPNRDGDVPQLLEALGRDGVHTVAWDLNQSALPDFSFEGLVPLARIANLTPAITNGVQYAESATVATLVHQAPPFHAQPACTRLSDGTGVWVVRYDTSARKLALYCPNRSPQFYAPGVVR